MAIKVKASTWKNITGAYVKRTTWSPVKQIYVKVVNTWKSVFLSDPPVIVSKPSFRLLSYSGAAATSPQFLDQSLYGKDGSYTNYTGITGRKITYSDTSDGLVRNTIISGDLFTTGAGITTSDRLTVDGKYLFYELTVSNGTDVLDSIEAVSDPMLMIKKQPALGSFTTALTGQSSPNSVLTFNYSLENYYYNKIVPATSKIRWWRSSNTTASGVIVKEETISATTTSSDSSSLIGTSTYTVAASSDNNSYIVVEIIGVSSWTTNNGYGGSFPDYQIASYSSGVIQAPYQFSFGNTLYVGSNGYIGLQTGGNSAGTSGSGRNINIWNEDLVQYRLQEYSDSSNYHLYFRSYRYQNPLVQSAINALDYQIKFYTAQPYCDVYLFRKGSSVPAYLDSPGYYKDFVNDLVVGNTAGVMGPFFWGAGAVMRIYFNEVTPATTTGISWTAISNSLWKDITTTQIDDSFTSVVTSVNQSFSFTSPTPSSVTYSGGVFTINFTGGSGPFYQGWYQTDSGAIGTQPALTGTVDSTPDAPQSGGSFTSSPLTRTLTGTPGYTYYWWVRSATSATITGASEVTSWSGPVSVTIPNATMTTAPTYGSATGTSDGFTASINNTPDPSGGTYAVVSNSNANASTSITSGGAVTVTGLAASASNTVTVSYAKFGFTTVQFTVTGTASAANTAPGSVRNLSSTAISGGARLSWDAPTSDGGSVITKYEITRNASNDSPPTGWFTNGTNLTYDYTLTPGTWTIYVRAVNAVGNGPASSVTFTLTAPFVAPQWTGTMPAWAATGVNGTNFRRTATLLQYGWNNGTFSFSGSTVETKGWDFYYSTTRPASTTTVRTPTQSLAFTTDLNPNQIYTTSFNYRGSTTYTSSSVYGSIRPYQYGTDGNKYVRGTYPNGTWSDSI